MPWVDQQKRRAEQLGEQDAYGRAIVAWLKANFPDLCNDQPHPAAISAVLHLHHRHGRGTLTAEDHGVEIRERVQRFEREHGEDGNER